ncbi:hypothetical protein VB618_02295 [Microvirga sp. CF3062]|uniref:hypothetical protein n=1 Tax=Microvirga sp. CF3062 TaxID=3110182 RepID=UPI002E78D4E7|nr:hypothetical protein [Microvirga sp. CF3062]MEE1655012.1 hypothetical protein [Microvirga sp. CF3062]
MSADRELLELAANAAGIEIFGWDAEGNACIDPVEYLPWNPLKHYSEAIRLSKILNLPVSSSALLNGDGTAISGYVDAHFARVSYAGNVKARHDAACHAIVRAAAEIGRAM